MGVCVIEDAHWADGATLDLLRFLARRVGSLPVLLVVTYRDDELNPQHPLAVALGDVATCAAVIRINLAPLSADAIAVLAAGSGVNANELYRLTGGNAFFVTEVLAVGPAALNGTSLPRSVSEAVLGRLGRLSQATRDTAHAVAVCGPRVSLELLEGVCPGAGDAVSECLGAGVLVGDATTVEFRHELARRAVLETIPKHLRRALHAKVLATLAEAKVAPKDLGALAFHADQAGDGDAAIRYGVPAAQRAAALRANRQAADLYELVLRRAGSSPPSAKAEWLEKHAFSTYLAGALDASAESWRAAIALRHELGDRVNEADNHRWLSHTLWPLGRTIEATESARASLGLLEQVGPCPQLAWSLVNLAQLAVFGFDPRGADYAVRALALGEQLGDHGVVFRARSYCLMAAGSRADTGWDELEDDWRNAMVADDLVEHAGLVGTVMEPVTNSV